jgi:PAS domain S-box-containing protein
MWVRSGAADVAIDMLISTALLADRASGLVLVTITDITEHKQTQAALRQWADAFEYCAHGIAIGLPSTNRFLTCNPCFAAMHGREVEAITGMPILDLYAPSERERVLGFIEEADRLGQVRYETDMMRSNGFSFPVQVDLVSVRDSERTLLYRVATVQDLTERKQAAQVKERLESQLRQAQKLEAIGTLAGGIAHDFNNILSPIIGYTEMALDEIPQTNPTRFDLKQVLSAAHRAKELVKQILAFSRKGEEQLMRPVDVSLIVKEALKLLRASIPSSIEIGQAIDRVVAVVDATQIHQVVVNLCTNAVHAMDERGTLVVGLTKVSLSEDDLHAMPALTQGSYLKLSVGDTGQGIDAETLERVFEPYFTTKGIGKGTGLGLAVVHGIVKRHGGEIRVRSEVGKGSIFDIFLPAVEEQKETDADLSQMVPRGTERILLVDDEPMLVDMSTRMLEQLGYHVSAKTAPQEAIDLFRASPDGFDLIITDYTMPHLSGAELAKKSLAVRHDIPIILCTGFSEKVTEQDARALGIKGFAMKPLDRRLLAELVRSVLDEVKS